MIIWHKKRKVAKLINFKLIIYVQYVIPITIFV